MVVAGAVRVCVCVRACASVLFVFCGVQEMFLRYLYSTAAAAAAVLSCVHVEIFIFSCGCFLRRVSLLHSLAIVVVVIVVVCCCCVVRTR